MDIKDKICYNGNFTGTVVSEPLLDSKGEHSLCNVVYDDGQHCTEKIADLDISNEINPNPPKW